MARLSPNKRTEKQLHRIRLMIDYIGEEKVTSYLRRFSSDRDPTVITKRQAQRLIIDLDHPMPAQLTWKKGPRGR